MELEIIIQELTLIENVLREQVQSIDCYLFGSILTAPKLANDIDVLIVYFDYNHLKIVKREFKLLSAIYPLHMNYFTFSEQKELSFIEEQNAKKIFSV